jgi:hypothetical protein
MPKKGRKKWEVSFKKFKNIYVTFNKNTFEFPKSLFAIISRKEIVRFGLAFGICNLIIFKG